MKEESYLEEEAELHAASVAQVMFFADGEVKPLHAEWEGLGGQLVQVLEVDVHTLLGERMRNVAEEDGEGEGGDE